MRIPLKSFIIVALLFGFHPGIAQERVSKTGTTAAQFLKIGVHARLAGMGGVAAAVSSDLSAIQYNPGGLARFGVQEVVFSQSDWLVGTKFFHISGAMNFGHLGVLAVQLTSLDYGDELVRTVREENGTGERWTAQDLSLGLAYARNLTSTFSMGAQLKLVSSRIWNMSAQTVAVDMGALYVTPVEGLLLGMSITNFGNKMLLKGRDTRFYTDPDETMAGNNDQIPSNYELAAWPIPLVFRVGLAYEALHTEQLKLTAAVDALHPSDNSEYLDTGAELTILNRFHLRGGVRTLFAVDQVGGLSLGAGLYHPFSPTMKLKLDYAWVDYGKLNDISIFTLSLAY